MKKTLKLIKTNTHKLTAALVVGLSLYSAGATAQSIEISPSQAYLMNATGNDQALLPCSDAGNVAWRSAIELGGLVPGIGTLTKAIFSINKVAVASVCKGGSNLTLDQILNEVEILIDEKLDEKFRDSLKDQYYDLLGQYEDIEDLLDLASQEVLTGQELLGLISKMENLSSLASSLEAETLSVGWAAMPATALISSLKHGLNVALASLYLQSGPEFSNLTDSFLNRTLPSERQNSIDAFLEKEADFQVLYNKIRLTRLSSRRVGSGLGGRHHFNIEVLATNTKGQAVYQRNWNCSANAATRSRCKNKWQSRTNQFFREGLQAWQDERKQLLNTLDENYFDYKNSLHLTEGKRFYLVNKRSTSGANCLDINTDSSGQLNQCSFIDNRTPISEQVLASASDIWRYHSSNGLLINENTGLCLSANDDKAIALDVCDYAGENDNRHQRWAINPQGFVLNLDLNNCLNVDGDPGDIPLAVANLEDCQFERSATDSNDDTTETDHMWKLQYIECTAQQDCVADQNYEPELFASRRVLQADHISTILSSSVQATEITDFSDSGYQTMHTVGDNVTWQDINLKAGRYQLSIRQAGVDEEGEQVKSMILQLDGVDQTQIDLPATGGEWQEQVFELDVSVIANTLRLEAFSDKRYHIDRVIFTPIP